jgi:cytochrome c oxidase assembly protein subunit 15
MGRNRPDEHGLSRGLGLLGWVTAGWMLLVVLWGAVVRATGSGAGCGDRWPLCNGDFFPQHPGIATVIEFIHRSTSGICTALVAALGIWIYIATRRGHPARRAWIWTAVLLITEALLGAVLVLRGYVEGNTSLARVVVQAIHFTNTLMLLGAMTATAWFLTRRAAASLTSERTLAMITVVATLVAGVTGSLAALADTLFPPSSVIGSFAADFATSSPWLVRTRWLHPTAAVVVFACAWMLGLRVRSALTRMLQALVLMQILLGIGDVLLLAPVWMQVLHLLVGDLFWMTLVIAWVQSREPGSSTRDEAAAPISVDLQSPAT